MEAFLIGLKLISHGSQKHQWKEFWMQSKKSKAALDYEVPKSSLGDRASGRIVPGRNSSPNRILNDEEETELVSF